MEAPKQDIRVTKTHKALAETMMSLLEKKRFQKITVNDICQEAMVSRSTFYLHFEDKFQLLSFCLQLEGERMKEAGQDIDLRTFLRHMLAVVQKRQSVYRNLFMAELNPELLRMFQAQFQAAFQEVLEESARQGVELAGPIPMLVVYYSHGLASLLMWWIENDFHYSIEEMALCNYNLLADLLPE